MMKQLLILLALTLSVPVSAASPLWQGAGRIAISADGNEHDHDDWGSTPLALALLAAAGLQDRVVLYTYSDHVWGSNQAHPGGEGKQMAYLQMRESALGGKKWFGFDRTRFLCAVDNPGIAYEAMKEAVNGSTAADPLFIIAAGPMQVVGEALDRADPGARGHVTLITHSWWNNRHSDHPNLERNPWDQHSGWTFAEIREAFTDADGNGPRLVHIADQNGGEDYVGLRASRDQFEWIKTSEARHHASLQPSFSPCCPFHPYLVQISPCHRTLS